MFEKDKWYIIRANFAGVFLGKIEFLNENGTIGIKGIRRLYQWSGALDVTEIAKEGVSDPENCKFSVQLSEDDISVVTNLIEYHPVSEKALSILNSIEPWKKEDNK